MARLSVQFPPETLTDACQRLGYTDRLVRHEIGISDSTWNRWKETDRIPVERLTDIVLLLELDMPDNLPADIPRLPWQYLAAVRQATVDLVELVEGLSDLLVRLDRIEQRQQQLDGPHEPRSG